MPLYNALDSASQSAANTSTELSNSLSNTASLIAPANINRKGLTIYNTLSVIVFIDTSNAISTSNFMFKLNPNSFYEMPSNSYTGAFWGILATGTGSVEIRELT